MPNTYNFFSKGVICTNAYSDSEWTTPSFSSYWTGRYSDKTMNLNTDIWFPFNENTKLLAEYFEEKGYFTYHDVYIFYFILSLSQAKI